ncbi:MAG: DEAD/DEAH box helicase [Prolixibacteraceae bacterium]|jgi:ATP-dependent RNA helicase DeaD|nr:DEAD/DEAH box helicase [Prolixibacteraceae bacterium]
MTFSETGIKPELIKAISEIGFEVPTPVQEKTIPHLLNSSRDLIALAQTGTGKTAAFGLPILHNTDLGDRNVQTLILCPTRELCLQITRDLENFSKYLPGFKTIAVYGGADIGKQIKQLRSGGQIVVGTPGRVNDLLRRNILKVGNIKWLVLDEADEMLTMGFKDEMDAILANTPDEKQTLLFSATMPSEIADMTDKYLKSPEKITIGKKNAGAENVEHHYYVVHAKDKYATLKRIADNYPDCYAIVFCRTRMETKEVADALLADGYNADALHGDLSQAQRDTVMGKFRNKNLQMLVATDVAARGLDVSDLSHAINYSLPDDPEVYIHRSGRTGRAGKSGISVSILHLKETGKIRQIERLANKKFERRMVPGGDEICEKQLFYMIDKVVNVETDESQIEKYLPQIYEKLGHLDREELMKKFVSIEFNRFLAYYKNASDLNVHFEEKRKKEKEGRRSTRMVNMFINAGKKHYLSVTGLIGMINDYTKRKNIEIGKIDIQRKFSFFEIESDYAGLVVDKLNGAMVDGFLVRVGKVTENTPSNERQESVRSNERWGAGRYPDARKRKPQGSRSHSRY